MALRRCTIFPKEDQKKIYFFWYELIFFTQNLYLCFKTGMKKIKCKQLVISIIAVVINCKDTIKIRLNVNVLARELSQSLYGSKS